jgi:hypothetical protein
MEKGFRIGTSSFMPNGRTKAPIHALGLLHAPRPKRLLLTCLTGGSLRAFQVETLINVLHIAIRARAIDEYVDQQRVAVLQALPRLGMI